MHLVHCLTCLPAQLLRFGVPILLAGLLLGCEGLQPYHVADPANAPLCDPNADFTVPEACRANVVEHSASYDLFFTEFTDQGLQFPSETWPIAAFQIDRTIKGLQSIVAQPGVNGVSIIVFVHGWKHNASTDDENVRSFRALLQSSAAIEEARGSGHRVVGVYIGWRGLSVRGDLVSNVSFWSRKDAALRVAQGSPRELFNRLRGFKCAQNRDPAAGPVRPGSTESCTERVGNGAQRPKVQMLMIGHSFGAWILYNAVAGSLIESLTHAEDTGGNNSVNLRFADMIVLLNPAFEASRYTPLHRVATNSSQYGLYQAPLLVTVTTSVDWATRRAFPAGRFINTILEQEVGKEERLATKYTPGHMTDYITHELRALPLSMQPAECANWRPLRDLDDPEMRRRQAALNLKAETANTNTFPGTRESLRLSDHWERSFCGGGHLVHVKFDPNSVIWNVHTDGSVMTGHNDITNPALVDFVRQLYHDTLMYPRLRDENGANSPPAPLPRVGAP